jgi:3-oxoacid CoA-transferase subunit A
MAILFSGDFHANNKCVRKPIKKEVLIEKHGQELYDSIKYHIILGDGGFKRHGSNESDTPYYEVFARRPFPVLCVLGEREPIYGMKDIPEVDIGIGETVYQINKEPLVAYLKRGKVYTIDGIKFLVLGGALSRKIDKHKHDGTWWEMEYWTEQEKLDVFKLLEKDNIFDCVISHTGPHQINKKLFENTDSYYEKSSDEVAFLNDEIHNRIQFNEWLCGHWHKDEYYYDEKTDQRYHYLYEKTKVLVLNGNVITIYKENQYKLISEALRKKIFIVKE